MTRDLPPLWRQLRDTAVVLTAVRGGTSAPAALARLDGAMRPGVQALAFQVLRQLGRAEALRALLPRRPPPPLVDALLCSALALAWDEGAAPYEGFTLVNQAVEAAKRFDDTRPQASFINACLRRFLRERESLVAKTDGLPVAQWNHPAWWIARLKNEYPQAWQQILTANNDHAPMALRVNVRHSTPALYLQKLSGLGIAARPLGLYGVALDRPMTVQEIPGFSAGEVSVQDAAAQMASPLLLSGLSTSSRPRVLDACAAPGGKTAHLLELADCQVTALDVDPVRCERIHENLRRLGLAAQVLTGDAAQPALWWDGTPFDAILLDAPCTASGIVRRHPDVRWLRRESDIAALAATQARLLNSLWPLLRPGGRMLYCTCSVFRAEGQNQIQTFLAHNTDAAMCESPGHLVPATGGGDGAVPDNHPGDHDGFYFALLEKRTH